MAKIRILDDLTINKIAAGEVIENPSSVAKELVENAIDSGASEITIETLAGGRGLIKVSDNGCGMSGDDLLLAIERHATSKILEAEELKCLKTLGFRGEALPSIASISKMTLTSALQTGEGNVLHIEGGKISKMMPLSRRQGTTIEVRSLFFNVPVRKKFQKSVGWDTGEIHKVLSHVALSYPSLTISWLNDTKVQFSFSADDGLDLRIKTLLGEDFLNSLLPVEQECGRLHLSGRIADPLNHRPNRSGQHLFINRRSVISPLISKTILEGYGTRLPVHRHPLFVLHLSIPQDWVDINVHPQKKEVRLHEEESIKECILRGVEQSLGGKTSSLQVPFLNFPETIEFKDRHFNVSEPTAEYSTLSKQEESGASAEKLLVDGKLFKLEVHMCAQIGRFFFVQESEGLRVVDGLRALEKVVFEELIRKGNKEMQSLLFPMHMTFKGKEKLILLESLNDLHEKGIEMRHFGGDTFVIDAIPACLEPSEVSELIYAYLSEGKFPIEIGKCLKRGEISLEAGKVLIEKLFKCSESKFTPNGKKIHYLLDEAAIKKLFI